MSATYLVKKKQGSSFLFRSIVPTDLQPHFGKRQFQLSLGCGLLKKAKFLSLNLHQYTQYMYAEARNSESGLENLDISKIKDVLKSELLRLKEEDFYSTTNNNNHATFDNPKKSVSNKIASSGETNSLSLSALSQAHLESRKDRGFNSATLMAYNASYSLLIEILDDPNIQEINHECARKFVSCLKKIPPTRFKKHKEYSITELLRIKGLKIMSHQTIVKHFERVSALINWAVNQGYLERNVFKGKLEMPKQSEEIQKFFTDTEVGKILGDDLNDASFKRGRPERFWVVVLGAFSGARLNEICQLDVSDIKNQEGLWLFDINDSSEDKKIKSKSSLRTVPLHPKILDMGFLDYVEEIRLKGEKKLFPAFKYKEETGYCHHISNWFRGYLKKLGIKKKGKNFHSLRHTVINKLLTNQVYEPFIKELVGHSSGSITVDVYGGRKPADVLLNECVMKI